MEIEDLVQTFKLLKRYNPKVLLEKEEIARVHKPRYYGKNRPDLLSERHLEVLRQNKLKSGDLLEAFASFLKRGVQLNIAKGLMGTDRFLQPQNTNKLEKAVEDVAGVFMMLIMNLENRLIFLIHQEYHTLTAKQALIALIFFAASQEGAQQTYIYLFKKIARERATLSLEEFTLFLNYYPHEMLDKYKNDKALIQLGPLLYDSALRKIAEELQNMDVKQFLSAFQGIVLLENRKAGKIPAVLVNSFLTEFFMRIKSDEIGQKAKITDFDDSLVFLEIYCKLLVPDGEKRASSNLTQALDSNKLSQMLWIKLFQAKLMNCSIHELAAILWVLSNLEANQDAFGHCQERLAEMLREEAAKGILPGTKDDFQDDIESTVEDLETIVLVLKEQEVLSDQVEKSVEESVSRLKVTHGGYHERKKWFYF